MSCWIWILVWLGVARAGEPNTGEPTTGEPDTATVEGWRDSVVLLVTGGAFCSGAVVDEEGTVATAYHCVASGRRPQVRTRAGDGFIGRIRAVSPRADLALLSVPELAGRVAPLAVHPDQPAVGQTVYGLGHPFAPAADRGEAMQGMLRWSVTRGIVSAVGPWLIQTDAALNPGNSGGPVVDERGRIVGITSRKLNGDNVAFAASAEALRGLLDEPTRPSLLGGGWHLGVGIFGGLDLQAAQTVQLTGQAIVRDRVLLGVGLGLPIQARLRAMERGASWYPAFELTGGLRQRFGRGTWSTTIDGLGGLFFPTVLEANYDDTDGTWLILPHPAETPLPGVGLRLAMGGGGLRGMVMLGPDRSRTFLFGADVAWPGMLGTF